MHALDERILVKRVNVVRTSHECAGCNRRRERTRSLLEKENKYVKIETLLISVKVDAWVYVN